MNALIRHPSFPGRRQNAYYRLGIAVMTAMNSDAFLFISGDLQQWGPAHTEGRSLCQGFDSRFRNKTRWHS